MPTSQRPSPATARRARVRFAHGMLALAAALSVTAVCGPLHAHGGFWRAYEILVEPGNPDHKVLRSDVWAFIETEDGGQTWHWSCAELYGGRSGNASEHRSMVLLEGGSLLAANLFEGLRVRRGTACDAWEPVLQFHEGPIVWDVVPLPGEPEGLLALTSEADGSGSVRSRLWQSEDAGTDWTPLGAVLPQDFSATSVAVAESDPQRVYVAGQHIGAAGQACVARSTDFGATWTIADVPFLQPSASARIAGVDPEDGEVVYFWADRFEGGGGDVQPDTILLSRDGALTWETLLEGSGNLPGFTFSPDGRTVLVAGPEDGIWGANAEDVRERGAGALARVYDGPIWGLTWTEAGLFAGGDDFSADVQRFSLGVSQDGGETFEPVFVICETELAECGPNTPAGAICPGKFSDPTGEGNFKEDFLDSERCENFGEDPPLELDAGTPTPGTDSGAQRSTDPALASVDAPGSTGCACRTAFRRTRPRNLVFLGAAWLALAGRRRRPRRPARRSCLPRPAQALLVR